MSEIDTNIEEEKLAKYLIEEVESRASGRKYDECVENFPRDVYFIGNLRPKDPNSNDDKLIQSELLNKLSPVAFGAEFLLKPIDNELEIEITLKWDLYYRVFPSYESQKEYQNHTKMEKQNPTNFEEHIEEELNEETISTENEVEYENDDVIQKTKNDSFMKRFKKISCESKGKIKLLLKGNQNWQVDSSNLSESINEEIKRAQGLVICDDERYKTNGDEDSNLKISMEALEDKDNYQKFLAGLNTDVFPEWSIKPEFHIRSSGSKKVYPEIIFSSQFVNESNVDFKSNNKEGFIFNAVAIFKFLKTKVMPFKLELAPRNFRYDRDLWGKGFNCAVEKINREGTTSFTTKAMPIFFQQRIGHNNLNRITFRELSTNPIPILEELLQSMKKYKERWKEQETYYEQLFTEWKTEYSQIFQSDMNTFNEEIKRFENGLEELKKNKDMLMAFKLTNKTFENAGKKGNRNKESWRLFQIVFLLTQMKSIATLSEVDKDDPKERDVVDIIYFPTGGGKTEAYLSVTILQLFFDRIRGKSGGVSVWTRFPLRLLTLQQMQRFADIIGEAELLRASSEDERLNGKNIDGFSVGYFVGKSSTPNQVYDPKGKDDPENSVNWSIANDEKVRQKWKKVIRCPSCQTYSVKVDFDLSSKTVIHRCTNGNCSFTNGRIPVYIVDNDIFRNLPSVLVGTLDKLASIGNQRKMALIFGQVDGKCSIHGYYKGKCCQKDCDGRSLTREKPNGISAPSLFIQDELHLLKEGLGTFDSHYETFIQALYKEYGEKQQPKIISSTATIEDYKRQVEHLYGRKNSRVFPGLGPKLNESFYSKNYNKIQRIFVGIIPHNKTIFNSILQLIGIYHEVIQELQKYNNFFVNPYGGNIIPNSKEWKELINNYSVSLVYFDKKTLISGIHSDIENAVNTDLERKKLRPLNVSELTGDTSSEDVSNILETLEKQTFDRKVDIDTLLATNTISHGVDIDSMNAMFFYGMPRQVGEYIQSSSRVGRSHTGIVFNCLRPERERDQSNYLYFVKQHEFLGNLVEAVAINRGSKFSLDRTISGLFMAVILQIIANEKIEKDPNLFYMKEVVSKNIKSGEIYAEKFIPILEDSYLSSKVTGVDLDYFKYEIKKRVENFLDQIISQGQSNWVSDAIIPKPMSSLRDVDEQVDISLGEIGSYWSNKREGHYGKQNA